MCHRIIIVRLVLLLVLFLPVVGVDDDDDVGGGGGGPAAYCCCSIKIYIFRESEKFTHIATFCCLHYELYRRMMASSRF